MEGLMRVGKFCCALFLAGAAHAGLACEMPPLMVIPAAQEAAGKVDQLRAEFDAYYAAMQTYTSCVQAELAAAGGDAAPAYVKTALVQRNNVAVAEVQAMIKIYETNVAPATVPVGPGAAPPAEDGQRRNRNRD
jgi:hypothetical protein